MQSYMMPMKLTGSPMLTNTHMKSTIPLNRMGIRLLVVSVCLMLFSGCGSNSFQVRNLAKSDTDLVSDIHIQKINALVDELVVKLYKRNPRELAKVPGQTVGSRIQQMSNLPAALYYAELGGKGSIEAMLLAFDKHYQGDRVFALGVGLRGMLYKAYGDKSELFLLDSLDPQKLYNSARNLEIVAWRLTHRRDVNGRLLLLTNSTNGTINLSFERLFGKMIATQDMISAIIADRSNRTINKIVHSIAQAVFLPV